MSWECFGSLTIVGVDELVDLNGPVSAVFYGFHEVDAPLHDGVHFRWVAHEHTPLHVVVKHACIAHVVDRLFAGQVEEKNTEYGYGSEPLIVEKPHEVPSVPQHILPTMVAHKSQDASQLPWLSFVLDNLNKFLFM